MSVAGKLDLADFFYPPGPSLTLKLICTEAGGMVPYVGPDGVRTSVAVFRPPSA